MKALEKLWRRARIDGLRGVKNYIRFIALRKMAPPEVVSAYGVKLKSNWPDKTFCLYVEGKYGFYYADYLRNISEPFVFFDIGANQGLYSLIAASNPNCQKVHAFEPVAETAAFFRANVNLNGGTQIVLHQQAISNNKGEISVQVSQHHTGKTTLQKQLETKQKDIAYETICCITHQQLNEIINVDPSVRIVVKIDVEGHEETVINELKKCSCFSQVSDIFYEVDERWVDVLSIEKLLQTCGFYHSKKVGYALPKKLPKLTHYDLHVSR